MWDEWTSVEAAQARAEAEDAERYASNIVPIPRDAVQRPEAPPESAEPTPEPRPSWAAAARPERPKVDDARGLKLYTRFLRAFLERDR